MSDQFIIRINNLEYAIDDRLEYFQPVGRNSAMLGAVPVSHLRFKEEAWYVLWDKKAQCHFTLGDNRQTLPLTVEWVQVTFPNEHVDRERINLLVMLFEVMEVLRSGMDDSTLKRPELALKKNIAAYLNKNDH